LGMTIGEKILARASGRAAVSPGEIVTAKVDLCMTNDATTHISIDVFEKQLRNKTIFDRDRVIFVMDHNVPAENVKTAEVQKRMRNFAQSHGIRLYEGRGICHQLMIDNHVVPSQLIIAADSHTCSYGAVGAFGTGVGSTDFVAAMATGEIWLMIPGTLRFELVNEFRPGVYARDLILKIIGDIGSDGANYKIMEFSGEAIENLTIDDRIVLCNLTVEAGAKTGLIKADQAAVDFIRSRGREVGEVFESDADAVYEKTYKYDLSELEPMVSKPHFVDNVVPVSELGAGIRVDQCFIGSCNNGRIEELRAAADILRGKKINGRVKLLISPASNEIYLKAIDEGLISALTESGAMILNPNCSVCWGSCQGVIGDGEVLVSTGTRNFKGRAGHVNSFAYLASAATVAASALTGVITDPRSI